MEMKKKKKNQPSEIDMAKERKAQEAADSQSMPKRAGLPTGNDLLPELIKKNKRKK